MAAVETDYPHVAEWVDGCGWIEVGTHFEPNHAVQGDLRGRWSEGLVRCHSAGELR